MIEKSQKARQVPPVMVRKLESGVFVAESRSPAPPRKTPQTAQARARALSTSAPPRAHAAPRLRPRRALSALTATHSAHCRSWSSRPRRALSACTVPAVGRHGRTCRASHTSALRPARASHTSARCFCRWKTSENKVNNLWKTPKAYLAKFKKISIVHIFTTFSPLENLWLFTRYPQPKPRVLTGQVPASILCGATVL